MNRDDYDLGKHYNNMARQYGKHEDEDYIKFWIDHAIHDIKLRQEGPAETLEEEIGLESSYDILDTRMRSYGFPEYVRDDVKGFAAHGQYEKASRLAAEAVLDPEDEPNRLEILANRIL